MIHLKLIVVVLIGGMPNTTKEAAESQNRGNNSLSTNKIGGDYV